MKRFVSILVLFILTVGLCDLQGLTISPQLREKLIREGAWEQFAQQFRQWQEQLEATYGPSPLRAPGTALGADAVQDDESRRDSC